MTSGGGLGTGTRGSPGIRHLLGIALEKRNASRSRFVPLKIGATLDAPRKRFPSEGKENQRKEEGKSKEKEAKSKILVSANLDFSTA
jgi:hypothetical protein